MRRVVLAFFGLALLCYVTAPGNLDNRDAAATMHAARALWHRGDSGLAGPRQGAESLAEQALVFEHRLRLERGEQWYGKEGRNGKLYVWFPMGHVWLMVPAVIAGDALDSAFPAIEQRFKERVAAGLNDAQLASHLPYLDGQFVWIQAIAAMWPAVLGAIGILLLYFLARELGAAPRDAMISTAAIALTSQFMPLVREGLSDTPGLCCLLAAMLVVARAAGGRASTVQLVLGGLAAGFAVLTRYPHGTLVPVLVVALAAAAWRGRTSWRALLWFALGGLPCLALLMTVNWLRHGDVTDTGYPKADSWFNYPIWFGATKILVAAGKGILWFSPLLWLVVPLTIARRRAVEFGVLGQVLFLIPFLMFSSTNGWQSGQCWGIRYVTPGVVLLLAIALPQLTPWRTWPRTFLALATLGLFVNVTGLVAPTHGLNQLAGQGVTAMYEREYQNGEIDEEDWQNLDAADHFFFLPRFSPLHANWTYCVRSVRGDFEDENGRRVDGSANTIEPLFGVEAVRPSQGLAPIYWEDRGFRHVWWVFWGALLGVSPWLLLLPVLTAAGLLLGLAARGADWRRPPAGDGPAGAAPDGPA